MAPRGLTASITGKTGYKGNELDLAGLVCNQVNDLVCINPKKGCTGGDTWAKRAEFLGNFEKDLERMRED